MMSIFKRVISRHRIRARAYQGGLKLRRQWEGEAIQEFVSCSTEFLDRALLTWSVQGATGRTKRRCLQQSDGIMVPVVGSTRNEANAMRATFFSFGFFPDRHSVIIVAAISISPRKLEKRSFY